MNIKRAKQEIMNAVRAYLDKNERGEYRIPSMRQRPILLIGPPGIGKTQIMEQIAEEMDLALAAYTITHHTRQSAIGLPFITTAVYDEEERSVTRYTMSEIIASVYDRMENSGKKEGILFIDEINCVSETLAPTMLQFLQGKSFGNQKVPEGWIIVAAGNPPEYNRSVRDFDVVTLDRVKKIDVEADFTVWKEYAYRAGIHGSVISYLDIHKENFYRMESTVDGKQFVTARGWEDLSEMIYAYERLGLTLDWEVAIQYVQHPRIAKDFANYLMLYYRYQEDYRVDEILQGTIRPGTLNKLKFAPFDEHLEVIGLLLSRLNGAFGDLHRMDEEAGDLYQVLQRAKALTVPEDEDGCALTAAWMDHERMGQQEETERRIAAGQNARAIRARALSLDQTLEAIVHALKDAVGSGIDPVEVLRSGMNRVNDQLEQQEGRTAFMLERAFDFMEAAFGESQEMVVFITELDGGGDSVWYLRNHDCDRYYMYNKQLLFEDRTAQIRGELSSIRDMQIT